MKKPILFLTLFIAFGLTAIAPALAKSNGAIFFDSGHARLGMTRPGVGECAARNQEFMALDGFYRINPDGKTFLHVKDDSVNLEVKVLNKRDGSTSTWSGDGKVVVNIIDGLGVFSAKGEVINTVTGELAKVKCFGNMHEDVWFIKLREITRNNKK
jgi:hypothetical protein